jgi:hypothetical protein
MNQIKALGLAVALMVGGCGEGDEPCGPRTGFYRVSYTARSGDCGAIPEQIVNLADTQPNTSCVYRTIPVPDACRSEIDITCTETTADGTTAMSTLIGVVSWAPGGGRGSGIVTIDVKAKSALDSCSGSYAVTYTKL